MRNAVLYSVCTEYLHTVVEDILLYHGGETYNYTIIPRVLKKKSKIKSRSPILMMIGSVELSDTIDCRSHTHTHTHTTPRPF